MTAEASTPRRATAGSVRELARVRLNAEAPSALADFFVASLGFTRQGDGEGTQWLALGPSRLEIARASGAAYPAEVPAWSPLFQHFAVAVRDVGAAYARLCQSRAWSAISRGGPQRLPPSSGGVTAFKFRSPEGHPLEFISAHSGEIPRIDHSAISVADGEASAGFYARLGLGRGAGSRNEGPEQARLDDLPDARVEVSPLFPPRGATHLELLAYRTGQARTQRPAAPGDVAATRLVFTADAALIEALMARSDVSPAGASPLLRDPDGHLLQFEP